MVLVLAEDGGGLEEVVVGMEVDLEEEQEGGRSLRLPAAASPSVTFSGSPEVCSSCQSVGVRILHPQKNV